MLIILFDLLIRPFLLSIDIDEFGVGVLINFLG